MCVDSKAGRGWTFGGGLERRWQWRGRWGRWWWRWWQGWWYPRYSLFYLLFVASSPFVISLYDICVLFCEQLSLMFESGVSSSWPFLFWFKVALMDLVFARVCFHCKCCVFDLVLLCCESLFEKKMNLCLFGLRSKCCIWMDWCIWFSFVSILTWNEFPCFLL